MKKKNNIFNEDYLGQTVVLNALYSGNEKKAKRVYNRLKSL
jgi:hypothetical protein